MISLSCVVENTAQRSSALWGEHGVSFAVETPDGKVLFDTGQSGDVLVHNAGVMGIHLDQFDALAISHAHYDHTGGLERFLANARPGIPLYSHPSLFQERFSIKEDRPESIGLRLTKGKLNECTDLHLSVEPAEILPGVWTTGEITDRTEFEGRSRGHFVRENGEWLPDPYKDDLSLVLDTRDGLVVVCGCCHAGLLNTLAHIRRIFQKNIQVIVGGTHLASTSPESLAHAIDILRGYKNEAPVRLYPNHCTGERAILALASAFGDLVQPCPAGTRLSFE